MPLSSDISPSLFDSDQNHWGFPGLHFVPPFPAVLNPAKARASSSIG
jgi:hypothetical protein